MSSQLQTQAFKTKTILQPRQNPLTEKYWGVALDVGYSSVKVFAPNVIASFPSYAKQVEYGTADHPIGGLEKTCIAYRDEDGNEYFVGATAQDSIKTGDADSSTAALYVRNRYMTVEFKAISRVGLALGMMKNQYGDPSGKGLYVQTGLPPEYFSQDSEVLKNCLAGHHTFSVKLGTNPWMNFDFELPKSNIDIMPQPMGTLLSISTDKNGGPVPEAKNYFSKNLLIFDPGFGTLDTFDIKAHFLDTSKTWDNLGMHRVLLEASKIVKGRYETQIPVSAMQKVLSDGFFKTKFDPVTRQVKMIQFADILEEANKKVCAEAIKTLDSFYNNLQDQDYLVVTGGTGAAWFSMIQNAYKSIESLKIIDGSINDSIPVIFSNVRGYYMNQLNKLKNLK